MCLVVHAYDFALVIQDDMGVPHTLVLCQWGRLTSFYFKNASYLSVHAPYTNPNI